MFLVVRDMAMPKHNNTSIGKFLTCYLRMSFRVPQDMDNTDATVTDNNLAFDQQLQYDLFILNIALHGDHGRNGF